ncbi:acetamidase/formamidase family protein [Bhargavaea beijingensis]|uniref:Acetamidase n=1 Tax=Bhargavaea beijingensis TaxID=426756 RepID=A0ABX9ZDY0_9BACL|nr:acetamidase/formamidase family protein [Bhargavaea beijingensis]MCW1928074.1 acetamidase/formamidase family protein [Bhargavaea beijingensis]RSK34298.1 acetamidase [Bhargavaea beijingensis]
MAETLACKDVIYAFDKTHEPVKRVESGTTIEIETYDCFENQVQSADTKIGGIDWERINPATGPIYVEGAQPGDVLKVRIEKLEIGNQGVMATGPDLGVLGHRQEEMASKIIPVEGDHAVFDDKLKIPLNKMIGVIGVAPEGEPVPCGTPGAHGGNMDTTLIAEGATLYFPVFAEGALFALGDFHAAMGDGEIGVSGIEVPGKATVTLEVVKEGALRHPLLENGDGIAFLVSKPTLDEAAKAAVEEMADFLLTRTDLGAADLAMMLSAAGQSQISQIVDPLMTARFFVPKYVLDAYNVTLFE